MVADGRDASRSNTPILVGLVVIGFGLIAAPAVFQMFDRAPAGREMIDEFRPFMRQSQVDKFRGFLSEMNAAVDETRRKIDPAAVSNLGLSPDAYQQKVQYLAAFEKAWPGINADMSEMLDKMERNLGNYAGVDALPPFSLFPWFFVLPGVLVVACGAGALVAARRGRMTRAPVIAIVVIGFGLIAAPAVFQMFTRAPHGGEMIDDFKTLMTREKVTTIQGYFITIATGETDLRNQALPAAATSLGVHTADDRFIADWPRINREMAPFVGVMADNLDNFDAVAALPPFALFPWFFVVPGALLAGLGFVALRRARREPDPNHPASLETVEVQ